MNKERLLILLVCALLLVNIMTMGMIYFKSPNKKGGPQMHSESEKEKIFQKHLNFDEDQMKAYRASKQKNKEATKNLHQELHYLSQKYYHSDNTLSDITRDSLLTRINLINSNIYLINTEHFDKLRSVCQEDQLPQLHEFIDRLILGREGHQGKGESHPRGRK